MSAPMEAPAPHGGEDPHLSKSDRQTLEALFHHPTPHNLAFADVVKLFGHLGSASQKHNAEFEIELDGHKHMMRRPHDKHLSVNDVLALRHFVAQTRWAPAKVG